MVCTCMVLQLYWLLRALQTLNWNQFDRWHPSLYGYLDIPRHALTTVAEASEATCNITFMVVTANLTQQNSLGLSTNCKGLCQFD